MDFADRFRAEYDKRKGRSRCHIGSVDAATLRSRLKTIFLRNGSDDGDCIVTCGGVKLIEDASLPDGKFRWE